MILQDIAKIIQDYMQLPDGVVWIKGQKVQKPTNSTFTIVVGFLNLKSYGSSCRSVFNDKTQKMEEIIGTNMAGQIVIDISGRGSLVLDRKEEIIQAMSCSNCREDQIKKAYLIGKHPTSFNDISGLDGTAIPYRFNITFQVQYLKVKTQTDKEYYDNFETEEIYVST